MTSEYYLSGAALQKLPFGKFFKFDTVKDMDGVQRDAVIWLFRDSHTLDYNKAYFDRVTGEYIAEAW